MAPGIDFRAKQVPVAVSRRKSLTGDLNAYSEVLVMMELRFVDDETLIPLGDERIAFPGSVITGNRYPAKPIPSIKTIEGSIRVTDEFRDELQALCGGTFTIEKEYLKPVCLPNQTEDGSEKMNTLANRHRKLVGRDSKDRERPYLTMTVNGCKLLEDGDGYRIIGTPSSVVSWSNL